MVMVMMDTYATVTKLTENLQRAWQKRGLKVVLLDRFCWQKIRMFLKTDVYFMDFFLFFPNLTDRTGYVVTFREAAARAIYRELRCSPSDPSDCMVFMGGQSSA